MNCVEALLVAAEAQTDPDRKYMLKGAAAMLNEAIEDFREEPSAENLRELNGVWAHGWKLLTLVSTQPPSPKAATA